MPTLRELEAGGRGEQVGIAGQATPTLAPVTTKQTKQVNLMLQDIQKLTKGATQITQAVAETSEYADKVRANDTYSNYVAGMNQINKFYQDKQDSGQALSVQDYRDKKDWQNGYMQDMLANSIREEDETNMTFREGFIKPATEMLVKQDKVDSEKMFVRMKKDWEDDIKSTSETLGGNITADAFSQALESGRILKVNNSTEKLSSEVADAHNANLVAAETDAVLPTLTIEGLADKHYPKVLSYNKDSGEFSRGKGFEDISDEAYQSMIQGIRIQHRKNTASASNGIYDTYKYDTAKNDIDSRMDKNLPISTESIQAIASEEFSLMSNPSFTKGQGGKNRANAMKLYNDEVKVYTSHLDETNSYFDGNVVMNGDSYIQSANGDVKDSLYGKTITKEFYIDTAKQNSNEIQTQLSSIAFTPDDIPAFKNQLSVADNRIEGLYTNQQVTGETPAMFKKFDDIETNVAGVSLGIDEAMLYARYRNIKATKSGHLENISQKIQQIAENPNMDSTKKSIAINNMVASNTISNTARTGQTDRIKGINTALDNHLTTWFADSVAPSGTNKVFSKIYAGTAPEKIGREIGDRDVYRLGAFGITTEKEEYVGLVLPSGIKESQVKSYMDKIVSTYNKDSSIKINEDDIDAEPVVYKGDVGYVLTIYQGSLEHKAVLNADTVKMGFTITTED